MVNSTLGFDELVKSLRRIWGERQWVTPTSHVRDDNLVRVRTNEDAEPGDSSDLEALDYPYEIQVSPRSESIDIDGQVSLARQMRSELEKLGMQVAIVADFEELV